MHTLMCDKTGNFNNKSHTKNMYNCDKLRGRKYFFVTVAYQF